MPTIDLIKVKKVFCTPKLSQDKDYRDRTPRNQFFLFGRSLPTAIRVSFLGSLVHFLWLVVGLGLNYSRLINQGDGNILTYALTFRFPDLGKEGNLLGLVIGAKLYLTRMGSNSLIE